MKQEPSYIIASIDVDLGRPISIYNTWDDKDDAKQALKAQISNLAYAIAYLSKAIESLDERFVRLDNYLQGSLGKHQLGDTTMRINTLRLSGDE